MKLPIAIIFLLMVVAQIFVPSKMILDQERILSDGKLFKFKLQPIDPNDPFRGKYVILDFEEDKFEIPEPDGNWNYGEKVFVEIESDTDGFIKIMGLTKQKPTADIDFVKAKIRSHYQSKNLLELRIDFPFDIFYMEENKAPIAESKFRQLRRDSATAWANVRVLNGAAQVEDVLIDGVSIVKIAQEK